MESTEGDAGGWGSRWTASELELGEDIAIMEGKVNQGRLEAKWLSGELVRVSSE